MTKENTLDIACYWDEEDRECGYGNTWEIVDNAGYGVVCGIEHVAVVMVTYEAKLPPAEDAESDYDWAVAAATREEAEKALKDEIERRNSLDKPVEE